MTDPYLDAKVDDIIAALEEAADSLESYGRDAATATAEAKRVEATAMLGARNRGFRSGEERKAYAHLKASEEIETADILERRYKDRLTYIRTLQTRLDLVRSQMVTQRQMQV